MVETIRANGWRQGSIFRPSGHLALQPKAPCPLNDSDCCIVLSQSCDIVCGDLAAEPVVELVVATRLGSAPDGNYTHAKNARRLQFHIEVASHTEAYDAQVRNRFSIPRTVLGEQSPDATRLLKQPDLNEVVNWILARYARHAFPDEFNRRIGPAVERKVKPILKVLPRLQALYVALNTFDELAAEKDYEIYILGTLSREDYEVPQTRTETESGLARIAAALNACKGIKVDDSGVQSEAVVTLDYLRTFVRWNFDYISLREPKLHVQPGTR